MSSACRIKRGFLPFATHGCLSGSRPNEAGAIRIRKRVDSMPGPLIRWTSTAALLGVAAWLMVAVPAATAANWQIDVVDTGAVGKYSSMKIDTDGNVHVAYVLDDGVFELKYAFWDRHIQKWFTMIVDAGAVMCSLALDSKQRPHISYADYGTGVGAKLRHAFWNGTAWQKEAIRLDSEIIGYYNSITFDREDNPSLTFYEYRGPKDSDIAVRLRNVMWNGKFWVVRTVDPAGGSGKFNAMASDAEGHEHLAYANVAEGDMRYAYWDGEEWTRETVESQKQAGGYVGFSAAITLDQSGAPHLAYSDVTHHLIKYAVRKNGRWLIEAVDRISNVAYPDRNSIALDENGQPYITYYDSGHGILKLAFREGGRWVAMTVDGNISGFTSSVQIARGEIWISYADAGIGGLKVARTELQALHGVSGASAEKPAAAAAVPQAQP